jgi:hypothetical protein
MGSAYHYQTVAARRLWSHFKQMQQSGRRGLLAKGFNQFHKNEGLL